ncbi:MAG: hypothetical protein LBM18_01420 [Oscillospiraceae bacterium]|jgi:hypothetical protein|nr:hypothetical protein [Oscillospiraceae bacterium]
MLKSRKSVICGVGICILALTVILCMHTLFSLPASAAEIEQELNLFLYENNVNYESIEVNEKQLSVSLQSINADRCSLEDVKAIQLIYQAVHGEDIIGNIDSIQINIYDITGKLIYDVWQSDVSTPVEDFEQYASVSNENGNANMEQMTSDISDIIQSSLLSLNKIEFTDSEGLSGKNVEIVFNRSDAAPIGMNDLMQVYDSLQQYSLSNTILARCSLSIEDSSGSCLLYLTGDFQYGNRIGWVSPEIEPSFVEHEGPPASPK